MEKSTGVIRKLDELGRIVIPKEIRDGMEIKEKDQVEIYTEGYSVIIKKYEKSCIFCGSTKKLDTFKDKLICHKCLKGIVDKFIIK